MINRLIANVIAILPKRIVWIFSKKYIAGSSIEDGIRISKKLNELHARATLDILGEFIHTINEAEYSKAQYIELVKRVYHENLDASVSLKPTSFGLLIDEEQCYENIRQIVELAADSGYFVRIDMEDSRCVDAELRIFKKLYAEFPKNVGIVFQAYMKRSYQDIIDLQKISNPKFPVNIRLCKGIYVESPKIAFKSYHAINDNFIKLLRLIIESGMYPAIATHDDILVENAKKMIREYNLLPDQYEFQMLYGVKEKLRDQLILEGHVMRIYVPFGSDWFCYSVRRLKENPRMISHILKSLILFWK